MADILQVLPIRAAADRVFEAVATPRGLAEWWTSRSSGHPAVGSQYELWFGPEHAWRGEVSAYEPHAAFELEVVKADEDWVGTRVSFRFEPRGAGTWVRFSHLGWPSANEHYCVSVHCWALYLRILRRYLEHGERIPYERRLQA
jgi:uncharacterized protein YndB with AHSA1/START domain